MKKNFLPIIATLTAALLGVLFTVCGEDYYRTSSTSRYPGKTLILNAQVFIKSWDTDESFSYAEYNGDIESLSGMDGIGGSGAVIDGQLSFIIGTPENMDAGSALDDLDVRLLPADARLVSLYLQRTGSREDHAPIHRGKTTVLQKEGQEEWDEEWVYYTYADRNVMAISPKHTDDDYGFTFITERINLRLKKGWNAVYCKFSYTSDTQIWSITLDNPEDLYWEYLEN